MKRRPPLTPAEAAKAAENARIASLTQAEYEAECEDRRRNPLDYGRPGWIYVVSSPDMPGLFKVGLTTTSVAERVKGLSANSSTPRPLVLEYSAESKSVEYQEDAIHQELGQYHHGKEWFRCELSVVIAACRGRVELEEPEPEPLPPVVKYEMPALPTFSECHGSMAQDNGELVEIKPLFGRKHNLVVP